MAGNTVFRVLLKMGIFKAQMIIPQPMAEIYIAMPPYKPLAWQQSEPSLMDRPIPITKMVFQYKKRIGKDALLYEYYRTES